MKHKAAMQTSDQSIVPLDTHKQQFLFHSF